MAMAMSACTHLVAPKLVVGRTAAVSSASSLRATAGSLTSGFSGRSASSRSCPELRLLGGEPECLRRPRSSASSSRSVVAMTSSRSSSPTPSNGNANKIVFVAGATGQTGKRIVKELLMEGYEVRAGVRDIAKAKDALPKDDNLELVLADVTGGPDLLARAIAGSSAVIVATGFRPSFDLTASWKVDNTGTKNMVDACKQRGINRMVLVSSILVNGAAIGQIFNPAYIVLNIFGLTLIAKLQAEKHLRKSGIDYTIIRPGGLKNEPPSGNILLSKEDTLFEGSVSRDTVAKVAVESLSIPEASFKVVELVSKPDVPAKSIRDLFATLR
ncbi:hypothetical protein KC19_5G184900 [Ceratodon purpureus]|uniref:NAD(P)-binding domain-containing protein n=1 Tax=Ceratodon purpureus TaxID=3225 RepID=A0A8T0I2Y2_CERPU|nr:hypothetical protein KC19_5G184900 [Ceratodon purpureus]